eukprot:152520_1
MRCHLIQNEYIKTIMHPIHTYDKYIEQMVQPIFFLLAYTNGPKRTDGPGKVLVGTYDSSGTLTTGNSVTFNPGPNDQSHLIELQSNGYFIVCASAGYSNEYDTACRIGQYSVPQLTIQFGTNIWNMTMGRSTNGMDTTRIDADTFISCFGVGDNKIGVCFVGTVTDDFEKGLDSEIAFGNEIVFNEAGNTGRVKITRLSQTVLAICYERHGDSPSGQCKLGVIAELNDGTKIIQIQSSQFQYADEEIDALSIFNVPPGELPPNNDNPELLGLCYVHQSEGVCRFGVVDLDALRITFDEAETNGFAPYSTGKVTANYLRGQGTG